MSTSNVIIAWEISPLKWYNLYPSISLSSSFPYFALPKPPWRIKYPLSGPQLPWHDHQPDYHYDNRYRTKTFTMTTNLTTCLQVLEDTINIFEPLTRADGIFFAGWLMRFPANPMQWRQQPYSEQRYEENQSPETEIIIAMNPPSPVFSNAFLKKFLV